MKQQEMFGEARWIEATQETASPLFRKSFSFRGIQKAELRVVGLGTYSLFINGRRVGKELYAPLHSDYYEWDYRQESAHFDEVLAHRIYVGKYDITSYLREGENVLGIWLAPGWLADKCWGEADLQVDYGRMKLCFSLHALCADGEVTVCSDDSVCWAPSVLTEYHFTEGEVHDYRLEQANWSCVGFAEDTWQRVREMESPETEYCFSDCPLDKEMRYLEPSLIGESGSVKRYDMGENISGYPILSVREGTVGKITVRVSEELTDDGSLDEARGYRQILVYELDGKTRQLKPYFTWLAYRYFEVLGDAEVKECAVVHADINVTSSFSCSDQTLQWLYDAYLRTQLSNMHRGIPSDCPHEERRGYTGDGQLTCESAMLLLDGQRFYRKWMEDISDCQDRVSGHVQYTAPYRHSGGGAGGWGCAIVAVPYFYYRQYGDEAPLHRMFDQMLHYLDYLEAHSEDGLVTSDKPGEWCLGDWCTPEPVAIPEPLVNTYFFVRSIDMVLEIAEVIGRTEQNERLKALRKTRCEAICARCFDAETGDFAGNVQGSNAFASDIGLGDERTFQNMVERYREIGMYDTGIFGTDIVTRLLFERGEAETAYGLLTSQKKYSFYHMMEQGATTLWEYWTGERSHLHPMFGAVVRLLFQYILGIRQKAHSCGYQRIVIAPAELSELAWAEGRFHTPQGEIFVSRRSEEGRLIFEADIPVGTEAEFVYQGRHKTLSAGKNRMILENNSEVEESYG